MLLNQPPTSHSKVGSLHSLCFPAPHCSRATLLWLGDFYPVTKLIVPNLYKMGESHSWKVLPADASTQAGDQGYFPLSREKQNIEG